MTMPGWIMVVLNLWAMTVGTVGFWIAYARRDKTKDRVTQAAYAFFVFMQCAMWGAEGFYLAAVVSRLLGHPWVVLR